MNQSNKKIAVIGLGYVGLPLAVEFGKKRPVIGFDINHGRIAELQKGEDSTLEVTPQELRAAERLAYSSTLADLADCDIFIVTVPTPIDNANRPDLTPLVRASETVGKVMRPGAIVIYESTVYPGCTEEVCVPVLERHSNLVFNKDFFCGYSPERINPGDKVNTLTKIRKITSGSTKETAREVNELYASIITAGTFPAASIKVAEAAKVIENTQRDVNIALVNELATLFQKLGIDTMSVLEAAGTKWNFLPFRPGLVGGHCIGVDPYYLTHKAQEVGHHPEIIMAGRRINDLMGELVASRFVRALISRGIDASRARVLVLGITFKENCPDTRNTKVVDVVRELADYGMDVSIHDPWADSEEVEKEYGLYLAHQPQAAGYDGVIIAVSHDKFRSLGADGIRKLAKPNGVVFDVKGMLGLDDSDLRL